MQYVYLLVDDAPEDFGGFRLLFIYDSYKTAKIAEALYKVDNPYGKQYVKVIKRKVRIQL